MSNNAPIPDVAEVRVRSVVNGKPVENCLWFHSWAGPITTDRLTTLATRVRNAWLLNWRNVLGSGILFHEVLTIDRSPSPVGPVSIIVDSLGGLGGPATASNIALGIYNLHALGNVGRKSVSFIYGLPELQVNNGVVDSTYANNLLGLWATNNQSHSPFGWHHIVVSLYQAGAPRTIGVWDVVTGYALARLNPAAQRRRLTDR